MSYEKFVMDADQCGAFHTFAAGMPVDENGFAMDGFHEVGPGKHFWALRTRCATTRRPSTISSSSDNNSYEQWSEEGSLDITRRANKRWKAMLRDYEPPPIDAERLGLVEEFVARRKGEMPDAWY